MKNNLAALVAVVFAFAQYAHAASDSQSARAGFVADATAPQANSAPRAPASPLVTSLNEGFDDISTLAGNGWSLQNLSAPVGSTNWFQGLSVAGGGPFDAFDGAANGYIGANYNNTGSTGTISNWLMTPQLDFGSGATLTFYTRKASPDSYADRLEVRLSTNGASTSAGGTATSVGDFTTLNISINPTLVLGVYPTVWTQYTVSGLPHSGSGRIAFRYFVSSAGTSGANSDYIGIDRVTYTTGAPEYQIGGNVSGLAGSGLVLRLNGTSDLPVAADGSFTFPPYLTGTASYAVTVASQPSSLSQTCTVANGAGTVSGTVTNVQVTCVTKTFAVGGNLSGLAGSGLTLQLNGGQDLAQASDGTFVFPTALVDGSAYSVTVATQPSNLSQNCVVSSGSGNLAGANVTNVQVTCTTRTYFVGGSVSGLLGSGLVLHLGSGQNVAVASNGSFMFANPVVDGSAYVVSVGTPPGSPNQSCTITRGGGNVTGADVTNVQVSCAIITHTIGGNVLGLNGSGLVLQLNGAGDLPIPADGSFQFGQAIAEGAAYSVTVLTQPNGGARNLCAVSNGSGTVSTMAVMNVLVSCGVIFISGFDLP